MQLLWIVQVAGVSVHTLFIYICVGCLCSEGIEEVG